MCPRAPHLALLEQFCADLAQPAICSIVMEAGMPMLLDRETGNGNWTGQRLKPVDLGQGLADVARQGGDQVRRADDRRQAQKAGQFQCEAPVDPLQAELFENPPRIANGWLTLKEDPGLGLKLSEAALKKFGARIL